MLAIQQSSVARGIPLPCFSGAAPQSGITPTLKIKLHPTDAGSTPSGTITASDSSGFAELVPSATDFGTVGYYKIEVSGTGIDTRVVVVMVTAYDPFNVLPSGNAGSGSLVTTGNLPTNFSAASISAGGKVAATLAAGDVSGNLPADLQTIKGQVVTATGAFSFDAQTTEQTNTAAIKSTVGTAGAGLTSIPYTGPGTGAIATAVMLDVTDTVGADVVAIKAKTDQLAFTAGNVNANTQATAAALTFNLTGNVTGNLSGTVGSVTGNVGGSVGSVTNTVNAKLTSDGLKLVSTASPFGTPFASYTFDQLLYWGLSTHTVYDSNSGTFKKYDAVGNLLTTQTATNVGGVQTLGEPS